MTQTGLQALRAVSRFLYLFGGEMMERTNKSAESGRPVFPNRALITAGMPYGNKELHMGHIGGLFVHADTFARFLRDRIGRENLFSFPARTVTDHRLLRPIAS
jgi:hypothetical protein